MCLSRDSHNWAVRAEKSISPGDFKTFFDLIDRHIGFFKPQNEFDANILNTNLVLNQ